MEEQANVGVEVPSISYDDNTSRIRGLGFCIDDDNDPTPENAPSPTEDSHG